MAHMTSAERIREYKQLLDEGMITQEEFELKKQKILEMAEVAEDAAAEGAVEYYSVNGVKLSAPQAGFNIVKYADGQVKKVFIK